MEIDELMHGQREGETAKAIKMDFTMLDAKIKYEDAVAISTAPDITDDIFNAMEHSSMSKEEKHKYMKHQLQQHYEVKEMTPEWVVTYGAARVQDVWMNMKILTRHATFGESLRGEQLKMIKSLSGASAIEIIDAPERWLKLTYTLELLKLNGFDLTDKRSFEEVPSVQSTDFYATLAATLPGFIKNHLERLQLRKEQKQDALLFSTGQKTWIPKHMCEFINSILNAVLGITIKKNARHSEQMFLFPCTYFRWCGNKYQPLAMEVYAASKTCKTIRKAWEDACTYLQSGLASQAISGPEIEKDTESLAAATSSILASI